MVCESDYLPLLPHYSRTKGYNNNVRFLTNMIETRTGNLRRGLDGYRRIEVVRV